MRRMQRIAHQHPVAVVPAGATQVRELPPDRVVGDQRRPAQCLGEQPFAGGAVGGLVHRGEAGAGEGLRCHLDDEGAAAGGVAVVMRVHRAEGRIDEGLGQRVEVAGRAVPDEAVLLVGDPGAEIAQRPDDGIEPVGPDHQIGRGQRLEPRAIFGHHPQRRSPPLQEPQKVEPADPGKADPVQHHPGAAVDDVDIAPAGQMRLDQRHRGRVVCRQEPQRLVRQHHAEAEGRIGRVLFHHPDAEVGARLPQPDRGIEAGGPGAHDQDLHGTLP